MKVSLSGPTPVHLTPRRHRISNFLVRREKPVQRRRFVSEPQHAQRTQDPRHPKVIVVEPRHPVPRVDAEVWCARDSFLPSFIAELQTVESEHPLHSAAETGSQLGLGEKGAPDFRRDYGSEAEHALFGQRKDGLDVVVGAFEARVWP
jgi:hypothetical protein